MSDKIIEFPGKKNIAAMVLDVLPQVGGNKFAAITIVMASFTEELKSDPRVAGTVEETVGAAWLLLYEEFLEER